MRKKTSCSSEDTTIHPVQVQMEADDHTYSQEAAEQTVTEEKHDGETQMEKRKKTAKTKVIQVKELDQTKPFVCPRCHKGFTRKGDMHRHIRTHTGEKPFSCPECGDEFSRKDDMIRHLRTHTGLKPFKCLHCSRTFSRRADMYKHMVTHAGVNEDQSGCPTCGCDDSSHCTDNPQPPVVRKRGRPKGSKNNVCHLCTICSKSFSSKKDMTKHIRTHTLLDIVTNVAISGETMVTTTNKENESHHDNMQVQVINKDGLVQEPRDDDDDDDGGDGGTGTEETSSVSQDISECEVVVISNALETAMALNGAIQIVTTTKALQKAFLGIKNDKPFHCPQCGDRFGRKSDMIRHLRIHSGLKPFNCNRCGRSFSRKEDMNRHALTHTGVKPYTCSICSKSFARKTDYETHSTLHSSKVSSVECPDTKIEEVTET